MHYACSSLLAQSHVNGGMIPSRVHPEHGLPKCKCIDLGLVGPLGPQFIGTCILVEVAHLLCDGDVCLLLL